MRHHPRLVGLFVLGAIALLLVAVVMLSSGGLFQPRARLAVFFPGSVKGLNRGAAVTFRGVRIGEVKDVTAVFTGRDDPLVQIEVVIELHGGVIEARGARSPFDSSKSARELADELLRRGIRARMMSQSLLTGQKYIELDFLPRDPARFAGLQSGFPELPTTPTAMERLGNKGEQFFDKLAELPVDEMLVEARKALQALQGLRDLLESDDFKRTLTATRRSSEELAPALAEARATLSRTRALFDRLDGEARETGAASRQGLADLRATLDRARATLARVEEATGGADDARVEAARTLQELSQTLQALRTLVDYVQTHPESLLLGKGRAKER